MSGSPVESPGGTEPRKDTSPQRRHRLTRIPRCGPGCADYARDHPRRGFRPAYHDARGEGWIVNHKKIQRLWREEGLRVPQRRRRKRRGTSTTTDTPKADAPNRVWATDFQFDATTDGRPIKIVSIIDEHTRECLGGLVERSITGEDLIIELDRLAAWRGSYPAVRVATTDPS